MFQILEIFQKLKNLFNSILRIEIMATFHKMEVVIKNVHSLKMTNCKTWNGFKKL